MGDHRLKTWPVYFDAIKSGQKTFEVRKDDRGFQRGDYLILEKYAPENPDLYSETLKVRVNWVLTGAQFGLERGYVCMAIGEVRTGEWSEDMCEAVTKVAEWYGWDGMHNKTLRVIRSFLRKLSEDARQSTKDSL